MRTACLWASLALVLPAPAADWPEWRGPLRDGRSTEKNLPASWAVDGSNMLWKAPFGARSSPVVHNGRVYLLNGVGAGPTLQERLLALDADTGKLLWEHRWNIYLSDVPPHRIAWGSPAVDAASGIIYTFGGNGTLLAISPEGKRLWMRSLKEDYSLFTTHGGRTATPLIDGDLVIVNAIASTWGAMANRSHRLMAFDKKTGETVWVSTPGGRPYDTSYSNPIIIDVEGTRQLVMGLGDGSVVGVKPQTGEPIWRMHVAQRGLNVTPAAVGPRVIFSHGDENLGSNVMGMVASLDLRGKKGELQQSALAWSFQGVEAGTSSPIVDGDRFYLLDVTANLSAYDHQTGKELWKKNLGLAQRSSPVFADGKIYVGTEGGKFYILRPSNTGVEILSEVTLPVSKVGLYSAGTPEPILGSPAIANGRVYFVSTDTLYCIGPKQAVKTPAIPAPAPGKGAGPVAWVQVRPEEVTLKPGATANFRALAYDARGNLIGEQKAEWSLDALDAKLTGAQLAAPAQTRGQAGHVKATINGVTGAARVRITPAPDYTEDFNSYADDAVPPHWISATAGRYKVTTLDGEKVLFKEPNETLFRRMRVFFGPNDLHDYTVEADMMAPERRRQLGDGGIFAQRYGLVLFGNGQRVELQPWQPETKRTVSAKFNWQKDTWYRLKLRVENLPGGGVRARGKVWKRGDPEPEAWLVERTDPLGEREGSPGIFGDAQFGVYYDNLKVTANR